MYTPLPHLGISYFSVKCGIVRFLWRENATFAISRHYTRFDVFVEAEANKAGGKYDNASIDDQINFYRNEGLTPYSEAKLPITSGMSIVIVIMMFIKGSFPPFLFFGESSELLDD